MIQSVLSKIAQHFTNKKIKLNEKMKNIYFAIAHAKLREFVARDRIGGSRNRSLNSSHIATIFFAVNN